MTAFLLSLARVGAVALTASALGWVICGAFLPRGPAFRLERLGWSFGVAFALLAAFVPLSFLAHERPGWGAFLVLCALAVAAGVECRVSSVERNGSSTQLDPRPSTLDSLLRFVLLGFVAIGVTLYALRALTEPMWANDFLAIWGFKGKTIFALGAVPSRLFESPALGFSHPEYPLGLPFLYAGASFLTGRWDDHALALLFPLFQIATLAVLAGWLRRRGASLTVTLLASALVASFEPLYSGFLTGMAEVPLSFGLILFGTALADALDGEQAGALRRLAFASALVAATKNEGLFFAAAGCVSALLLGARRRWRVALAALPTALVIHGLHLAWRGQLPLRDFDLTTFSLARVGEALAAAARVAGPPGWLSLGLVAALIALGSRRSDGDRLLLLAACGLAAYLILPAFAVRGPAWLVEATLLRTTAGLVPLLAAAVAVRFGPQHRGAD